MDYLKLVNAEYPLEAEFVPEDLVQDTDSRIWAVKEALLAFYRLNEALKEAGNEPLVLISGYRSYAYQKKLYEKKVKKLVLGEGLSLKEAEQKAASIVAYPGTSEHQLGLAIDVTPRSMQFLKDPLTLAFDENESGIWMKQHAFEEGFILRYPKEKQNNTHITYEPWHYRYVGKDAAVSMAFLGLSLEEYVMIHRG